ncbi:hypothetical protein MF271_01080 (plasmid) [Deinococcus sp. KNUC1210]|uniref:hypothetical protein n=1 Tax=Deinococcus sp. KNUC1210 TaxID=2917691 RepID=UPI001EEFD331|nr:hypothetical protein [Deinococcus sp. KNUC1210]ULH13954.1 hypothetical protein MF271_01080 [Deinococcus sp. KNUC1210]
MSEADSCSCQVISDPAVAAFLSDPRKVTFITPFLAAESTVTGAARAMGVQGSTMLYRVRQMLRLGLLVVSRTQLRAGRPIQHYRSSADVYFVPFEVTPYATSQAQFLRRERHQHEVFAEALAVTRSRQPVGWGLHVRRDPGGSVLIHSGPQGLIKTPIRHQSASTEPLSVWSSVTLLPEAASELNSRLQALVEEYIWDGSTEGGQPYLLHIGLVPRPVSVGKGPQNENRSQPA